MLIVVDELGKNLEFAAEHAGNDLYLLQQLAERVSSRSDFSGGVLTLAHLAFEDYLVGAGDARRREWRKIHGRFEDIPFVANTAHSVALLADALVFTGTPSEKKAAAAASVAAEEAIGHVAPTAILPGDLVGSPVDTYPLHPSVAMVLPALAAQLGQHDRSLVAFLTSDAPHALPNFLSKEEIETGNVPFIRLSDLYDYFFSDGTASVLTGSVGERAREIQDRVDGAQGLDEFDSGPEDAGHTQCAGRGRAVGRQCVFDRGGDGRSGRRSACAPRRQGDP